MIVVDGGELYGKMPGTLNYKEADLYAVIRVSYPVLVLHISRYLNPVFRSIDPHYPTLARRISARMVLAERADS